MHDDITPVLLTFNEARNIGRTLERLRWAQDIVVVDSMSTDETTSIVQSYDQVRVYTHPFESHADQWDYAVNKTGIQTPWVLALDADYLLTQSFVDELSSLRPGNNVSGYRARFRYCVFGRSLSRTLYPPLVMLFRIDRVTYEQDGHTHRARVEGDVCDLKSRVLHDDRKPLRHWLQAQDRYMKLEAEMLTKEKWRQLNWPDRIRKAYVLAPFGVLLYCLFIKRGIFDGRAGLYYAIQRMLAEGILSLRLLQIGIESSGDAD